MKEYILYDKSYRLSFPASGEPKANCPAMLTSTDEATGEELRIHIPRIVWQGIADEVIRERKEEKAKQKRMLRN